MKTTHKLFLVLFIILVSACRKDDDNGAYGYQEIENFEVKEIINGGQIAMINELS